MNTDFDQFASKNLLILTPAYPNADGTYIGESFVKNQVDELRKYFKEIIVISPAPFSFKLHPKDKLCNNYSYDNVRVYYPRSFYIPVIYFRKMLIDNRLQVVKHLIKKENISFDVIHAHFTWPSGYIGVKLKSKYNVPVIITLHAESTLFYKELNMNYLPLNHTWINADALIRVNRIDIPALKKLNENSFYIPNGFSQIFKPLNQNECRRKLNLPSDKKIIFSLGYLIERKGFRYLIEAIDVIEKKGLDVLCFIGGSGLSKTQLQKQIDNLNLTDKVKLIGFIPNELLPTWMNACDIFVLPSLSESFGIVQVEAMACGKPVVSTYNGGSEDVVISEDYGSLCEPSNSQQLANNIIAALNKDWDETKIIKYAGNFTWNDIACKLLDIYNKIC